MEENQKPQFVIDNDPVIAWPVIVCLPSDGGEFAEYQFTVFLRVLSPADYETLFADAPGAIKKDEMTLKLSEIVQLNVPIFQRLVTGWDGIKDQSGVAVNYTPDLLSEQINGPYGSALSAGLWRAINEVRFGARLKN